MSGGENQFNFARIYVTTTDALGWISLAFVAVVFYPDYMLNVEGSNSSETARTWITIAEVAGLVYVGSKCAFDSIRECLTDYSAYAQRRASWLSASVLFMMMCGFLFLQLMFAADPRPAGAFRYFPLGAAVIFFFWTVNTLLMIRQTRRESDSNLSPPTRGTPQG